MVLKEKFTAPTSGLEKVTFSRGSMRYVARFKDTLDKLAQHVGTWHVYGEVNAEKAMKDMAEPVFTQPVHRPRKYYKFQTDHQISDRELMVKTSDRFTGGQLNTKLVDKAEWKLDLDLFMVLQSTRRIRMSGSRTDPGRITWYCSTARLTSRRSSRISRHGTSDKTNRKWSPS